MHRNFGFVRVRPGYLSRMANHLIDTTDSATACRAPVHPMRTPIHDRLPPPLVRAWWRDWSVAMIVFAAVLIAGTVIARYFS